MQAGAGDGSAIDDEQYEAQGARIVPDAAAVFARGGAGAEGEGAAARGGRVCCARSRCCSPTSTSLRRPSWRGGCARSGAICVAYETVEDRPGRLPLLAPMSEIAGKIATQAGAFMLEKPMGGRGILLGGVPGRGGRRR